MSLVFDLLDKDKKYKVGTPEDLWKELAIRYDERIVAIYSSHLTRYAGATADTDLFKELEDYGPLGKEASRFIIGYIGMDDRLPSIDPEAWIRKRDESGRFTYSSSTSPSGSTHTWAASRATLKKGSVSLPGGGTAIVSGSPVGHVGVTYGTSGTWTYA